MSKQTIRTLYTNSFVKIQLFACWLFLSWQFLYLIFIYFDHFNIISIMYSRFCSLFFSEWIIPITCEKNITFSDVWVYFSCVRKLWWKLLKSYITLVMCSIMKQDWIKNEINCLISANSLYMASLILPTSYCR